MSPLNSGKPCTREVYLVGKSPLRGDILTARRNDADEMVRVRMPADNAVGDILVWRNAGAYVQAVRNTFLSLEEIVF